MEMKFPKDYPMNPPFVRVIRPRFKFLTGVCSFVSLPIRCVSLPIRCVSLSMPSGHITVGGSICMQMLTRSGWSPSNDIEVCLCMRVYVCVSHNRVSVSVCLCVCLCVSVSVSVCIPYIANHSREKFHGFCGLISNHETFPNEIACAIDFSHIRLLSNRKCFSANYSLVLQLQTFPPQMSCNIW